jgi:hypothetical protein
LVGRTSPITAVNIFMIWTGKHYDENCCELFHYLYVEKMSLSSYIVMSSILDNVENKGFHSKLVQYGMDVVLSKTNST